MHKKIASYHRKTTLSQSFIGFQGKVALANIKGDNTIVELSEQFDTHSSEITQWKNQLLECAAEVFGGPASKEP